MKVAGEQLDKVIKGASDANKYIRDVASYLFNTPGFPGVSKELIDLNLYGGSALSADDSTTRRRTVMRVGLHQVVMMWLIFLTPNRLVQ